MKAVLGAFRNAARDTFVGGPSLFWLAPAIPLLLLIPEFAQHVAEIRLGMFESREAAQAIGNSPTRWAFGYVKIAGIFLCALAAARYWGGLKDRWWDIRTVAWRGFLLAFAANAALIAVDFAMSEVLEDRAAAIASTLLQIATFPFLVWLVGTLLGDRTMTLRLAYRKGWLALLVMVSLAGISFAVGQWVHTQNHRLAFGAPEAQVWALMVWDSVWTALFVTCAGSALGAGYRAVFGAPAQDNATLAVHPAGAGA